MGSKVELLVDHSRSSSFRTKNTFEPFRTNDMRMELSGLVWLKKPSDRCTYYVDPACSSDGARYLTYRTEVMV